MKSKLAGILEGLDIVPMGYRSSHKAEGRKQTRACDRGIKRSLFGRHIGPPYFQATL